jgi:RND family efflux transporter MFP subunit
MPLDQDAIAALRIDRDAVAAKAQRRAAPWIFAGAAIALLAAGLGAWWLLRPQPVVVKTAEVRQVSATQAALSGPVLSASGYVVARRISTPSAKITAQVRAVYVEEGMRVGENQILADLDDTTPRAQLALAESRLALAQTAIAELKVRLAEAERTLARNRSLVEQKLVSQAVVDAADAEVEALRARIRVAGGEVEVAERNVAVARQAVEDTIIRAPFAGVVVSKDAQPGEMISPISAGGGFTRTGICTIVDMDSLEIEVDVNEAFINRVGDGQRVEAILDAYPDWRIPAHVISIVPTADRQKATVKVRIGFEGKDPRILPDMGVQVQFMEAPVEAAPAGPAQPRLLVAANAIVSMDGRDYVFRVEDDRVERRAVKVGPRTQDGTDVFAGLQAGDVVVLDPPAELADGAAVEIRN